MDRLKQMKILIIDDSPESIELVEQILKKEGFENIQTALSADQAFEIVNHFPLDLVLLDIVMPEMNGFEFCKLFKAHTETMNIPVIMMSGSFRDSDDALQQAFKAGAVDFITKPIRHLEMLARVKSVLNLKWANDSVRQELAKQNLLNERLQNALRFIDSIIETSLCGIVFTDSKGCITRVNSAYLQMLGYDDEEEMLGKFIVELTPREPGSYETVAGEKIEITDVFFDKTKKMVETLFKEGRVPEFKSFLMRKDGKLLHSLENEVLIYNDKKELLAAVSVTQDISMNKQKEKEKESLITELQGSLKKVKLLSGLLPICSSCKKIRDDKGYWNQIDSYVREHSEAEFSHSICPDCAKKLYPEYINDIDFK